MTQKNFEPITRWYLPLMTALTVITSVWLFVADFFQKTRNSYQTYYFAAKALNSGNDLYLSHAPGANCQYVYPPLFAFVSIPPSYLSETVAIRLWLVVNVVLTFLALGLGAAEMMRRFRVPGGTRVFVALCCGAFWLSIGELKTEWATGQTDTVILFAFVLALRWLDRLPWLAGAALGFGANIKYQTLVTLPWMLLRRRWTAALAVLLATLSFAAVPAVSLGWAGNLRNLGVAFAGLGSFVGIHSRVAAPTVDVAWLRSVSITSASARLLKALHGNPSKALTISGIVAIAFLGIVAWLYRAHSFRLSSLRPESYRLVPKDAGVIAIEWIGLMVAWLAFGPEVSRRHMFVLILLHLAVLALLANPENRFRKKPLVIALILWQLGCRLPPTPSPSLFLSKLGDIWSGIGGPSWCLLFLFASLVFSGLTWARATLDKEVDQAGVLKPALR